MKQNRVVCSFVRASTFQRRLKAASLAEGFAHLGTDLSFLSTFTLLERRSVFWSSTRWRARSFDLFFHEEKLLPGRLRSIDFNSRESSRKLLSILLYPTWIHRRAVVLSKMEKYGIIKGGTGCFFYNFAKRIFPTSRNIIFYSSDRVSNG